MIDLPPPEDDGLYTPEVAPHSRQKHHFLWRYLSAFTTAMKSKGWSGLHYVDPFSNAGIERLRGRGALEWGSPLLAAQTRFPFTHLHCCDINEAACNALRLRLKRVRDTESFRVDHGDANARVSDVVQRIPPRSLVLAFLDPYGLRGLSFETVKTFSHIQADLIIFFPDYLDALRNLERSRESPDSPLATFLGVGDWYERLAVQPWQQRAEVLYGIYCERLRELGLRYQAFERIERESGRLYRLIFCSHHPKGEEIWRKVQRRKPGGQDTFDF